jgi:hypothetical protein
MFSWPKFDLSFSLLRSEMILAYKIIRSCTKASSHAVRLAFVFHIYLLPGIFELNIYYFKNNPNHSFISVSF